MPLKQVEVLACSMCDQFPAKRWELVNPAGSTAVVDLCPEHAVPLVNVFGRGVKAVRRRGGPDSVADKIVHLDV